MEQQTNIIRADDKSIREMLDKTKYIVDFFQREYRWERKHIEQLIDDLTTKFLANYDDSHERKEVQNYERYYLGPIVLSVKRDGRSIIDGQQRLASITLLLIYLNALQKDKKDTVPVNELIFSERFFVNVAFLNSSRYFILFIPNLPFLLKRLMFLPHLFHLFC